MWYGLKSFWVYLLLALVFGTILIVFFVSLQKDSNLATPVLAFATVILAIATVLTIINSKEQEKHRRQGALAKEGRDKDERLLNEIIEWAEDIITDVLESNVFDIVTLSQGINRDDAFEGLFNEVKNLRKASAKSTKILTITHKVDQALNENIEENVQALINELGEQIGYLMEYRRDPNSGSMGDLTQNIPKLKYAATHNESLINLAIVVIKEAIKIKTREIGGEGENMSKESETTGSNEPTLKDIEEHLKRQDRQTKRMIYFAGAAFGASIILVAVSLWIGRVVLSATAFFWQYIFLLTVGFGFMSWCWYKLSKVK